jgi:nucleoside-diphosphate-sugar epimerase
LRTQGVEPPGKSLPRWLVRAIAAGAEIAWRTFRLKSAPPITRTAVRLVGEEVTLDDGKARRDLGYRPVVSIEEGLRAMSERATAAPTG